MSFIIKKSNPVEATQLRRQYQFISRLPSQLAPYFPRVSELQPSGGTWSYRMEKFPTAFCTLRDWLFATTDQTPTFTRAKSWLSAIVDFYLGSFCVAGTYPLPKDYCEATYFGKFAKRVAKLDKEVGRILSQELHPEKRWQLLWFKKLLRAPTVTINGEECKNPKILLAQVRRSRNAQTLLCPPRLCCIHGDLHFDNILIKYRDRSHSNFRFIDPGGFLKGGDIAYDLGKLLHSVHGLYDFMHQGYFDLKLIPLGEREIYIQRDCWEDSPKLVPTNLGTGGSGSTLTEYKEMRLSKQRELFRMISQWLVSQLDENFKQHTQFRVDKHWKVRAHFNEALHFLTMGPYHVRESVWRTIALHAQGIQLLNGLVKKHRTLLANR